MVDIINITGEYLRYRRVYDLRHQIAAVHVDALGTITLNEVRHVIKDNFDDVHARAFNCQLAFELRRKGTKFLPDEVVFAHVVSLY